jgi:hypothetical protein
MEKAVKLDELAKISPQKHVETQQSTRCLSFTEAWNTNWKNKENPFSTISFADNICMYNLGQS